MISIGAISASDTNSSTDTNSIQDSDNSYSSYNLEEKTNSNSDQLKESTTSDYQTSSTTYEKSSSTTDSVTNTNKQVTSTDTSSSKKDSQQISTQTSNNETYSSNTTKIDNSTNTNQLKTASNDSLKDPNITMNDYKATTNSTVQFSATLDSNATGNAVFKINGKTVSEKISIENGTVSYDYDIPLYSAKDYNITVVYSGNSYYESSSTSSVLTLEKITTTVSLDNIKAYQDNDTTIKAYVYDVNNNPVSDQKVSFKVNGKTIGQTTVENGVASINYNFSTSGYTNTYYDLEVVVGENSYYNTCRNSSQITLVTTPKITFNSITSKTNNSVTLTATLPSNATGNAVFKINSKTISPKINVTDSKVTYTYDVPLYSAKNYTLTFSYSGNSIYYETKVNSTLTLTKLDTNVKVADVTAYQNRNVTIIATVTNEQNNPASDMKVSMKVNDKTIASGRTDDKGKVTFVYNLTKDYTQQYNNITIIAGENSFFNTSTTSSTLNLIREINMTFKSVSTETGKVVTFNSTLTDLNHNRINEGTVTFYINGTSVGTVNVRNGSAVLSQRISLYDAGTYVMTAEYTSNGTYLNSSTKSSIVLSKISTTTNATDFNFTIGNTGSTTISVYDQYGKLVSKGDVTVTIDNVVWGTYTLIDGQLKLNYTPSYKFSNTNLSFKVVYNENGVYTKSTYTSVVSVNPLITVYVSNNGSDSNLGDKDHPFKTISYALSHVKPEGVIYLNPGTYNEMKLVINNSVNITGLSSNPENVVINANNQKGYIFNLTSENSTVYMNNFTIKNINVTSTKNAAIISDSVLSIENMVFENSKAYANQSATAIYSNGYLVMYNSTIRNNNIYKAEAAAIVNTGGNFLLYGVMFNNNKAECTNATGPALYLYDTNATLYDCSFTNNIANGTDANGGAITTISGNLSLNENTFTNNSAYGKGAVVGGAIVNLYTELSIVNSIFNNNSATSTNASAFGGAFYIEYSDVVAYNSTFKNNYVKGVSAGYGGVAYSYFGYLLLSECVFDSNNANATNLAQGGALVNYGGTIIANDTTFSNNVIKSNNSYGGAIYFIGSTFNLTDVSFTNNIANATNSSSAGAIYVDGNATIEYCNFTSNRAISAIYNSAGAIANNCNLTVTYSNFVNNAASLAGSAIVNFANVTSIENNYWGSSSPSWSSLLYGVSKPSSYKTSTITH